MLTFRTIEANDATLTRHEVLAPISLALIFFREDRFAPLMLKLEHDQRN